MQLGFNSVKMGLELNEKPTKIWMILHDLLKAYTFTRIVISWHYFIKVLRMIVRSWVTFVPRYFWAHEEGRGCLIEWETMAAQLTCKYREDLWGKYGYSIVLSSEWYIITLTCPNCVIISVRNFHERQFYFVTVRINIKDAYKKYFPLSFRWSLG